MEQKNLHTAEDQHIAMDKIGGFVYQFYCFLYHVLTMNKGEEVSFEKLDDAAVEAGNLITLYQAKHTIQVGAEGNRRRLTDRSTDLWKAIDVWRKLIMGKSSENRSDAGMRQYIKEHEFVFISNKLPNNRFVSLCKEVKEGAGDDRIDAVLDEITQEGRSHLGAESPAQTQIKINLLKEFGLKKEFLKKIRFEAKTQEEIKNDCIGHIADRVRFSDEDAPVVFKDFMTEAVNDFFDKSDKGTPLSYTFDEQRKRFEHVFQFHREEKLDFRITMEQYKKEFLDLVCIQQLIKVNDFSSSETDKVAKYASYYYSFKNRYDRLREDSRILDIEDKAFRMDAINFWDNEFGNAYDELDEAATDATIIKRAKKMLYEVRKHKLKLCREMLGETISNGAFYYLSDECLIGWHRDWKLFFKKQNGINGQDNQ